MSSRIVRLLIAIALIALVSIVFLLNPHSVAFRYGYDRAWEAPLALIVIVVFCCGVLLTALVSAAVGLRLKFQLRGEQRRRGVERRHLEELVRIRERIAVGQFAPARAALERILEQDPENMLARLMLARALRKEGQPRSALAVLEEARTAQVKNLELLRLCAEINEELGNVTAAYDNWALIAANEPQNLEVLQKLSASLQSLGFLERAVDYQQQLVKGSAGTEYESEQRRLAELRLMLAQKTGAETLTQKRSALEDVLRRHRDYAPALAELARLEKEQGARDAAAKLLLKAFKSDPSVGYLQELVSLWLEVDEASRAVGSVRTALSNVAEGSAEFVTARLFFIKLLFTLGMRDEAEAELGAAEAQFAGAGAPTREQVQVLRARLAARKGRVEEALDLLLELHPDEWFPTIRERTRESTRLRTEPLPPQLSTP